MASKLRIFADDHESGTRHMTMTVGEFCQILSHASNCDRTWLQDFENDEIRVSLDLFVVMQAYWNMRHAA